MILNKLIVASYFNLWFSKFANLRNNGCIWCILKKQ